MAEQLSYEKYTNPSHSLPSNEWETDEQKKYDEMSVVWLHALHQRDINVMLSRALFRVASFDTLKTSERMKKSNFVSFKGLINWTCSFVGL